MKSEKINYTSKIFAANGAETTFNFHADNKALAYDHVQHCAFLDGGLTGYEWDKPPDKIYAAYYKGINAANWLPVFCKL